MKMNWLGHYTRRNCLMSEMGEIINEKRGRERKRFQLIVNIKIKGRYGLTKKNVQKAKKMEGQSRRLAKRQNN